MIQDIQSSQILQKRDRSNKYAIMKIMLSSSYRHNRFMATHVFGHMMYNYIMLVT